MGGSDEMYVPTEKEKERVPLRWCAPEGNLLQ